MCSRTGWASLMLCCLLCCLRVSRIQGMFSAFLAGTSVQSRRLLQTITNRNLCLVFLTCTLMAQSMAPVSRVPCHFFTSCNGKQQLLRAPSPIHDLSQCNMCVVIYICVSRDCEGVTACCTTTGGHLQCAFSSPGRAAIRHDSPEITRTV